MTKVCTLGASSASTASDINGRRMLRSGGAGSNILEGLSSRRPVPSLHCHFERPTGVETSVYIPYDSIEDTVNVSPDDRLDAYA